MAYSQEGSRTLTSIRSIEGKLVEQPVNRGLGIGKALLDEQGGLCRWLKLAIPWYEAKKLGLQGSRQFSDFIEQDRAAVAGLETAGLIVDGASERSADVTEQLVLQQMLGESRAGDHDKRSATPRTPSMNLARKYILAGTALAVQENCGVGGRGALHRLEQRDHRGVLRFEERGRFDGFSRSFIAG